MRILLIGPQGSGKSTQGKLLAEHLQIPFISMGDIFRQIASEDSEEGRRIKSILDQGKLVDDQTTRELVKRRLQNSDVRNGFILDGYPRTSDQVALFDTIDMRFDKIFYLDVPDEEVIKRLMSRGRSDDTLEVIRTRLDVYKLKTEALIQALKGFGNLVRIDGSKTVNEIQDEIRNEINKRNG